jgi:hypothetical protein
MTDNKQKTGQDNGKTSETTNNKPYGRASIPVEISRGNTKWYTVGPVWNKKDGEGLIVDIETLPVQFLTGNFEGPLRVVITPTKNDA